MVDPVIPIPTILISDISTFFDIDTLVSLPPVRSEIRSGKGKEKEGAAGKPLFMDVSLEIYFVSS